MLVHSFTAERKIIFKARVGSHLHGTATESSDEDFLGVFLPSTEDLLGVQNRPSEWTDNTKVSEGTRNTKGDVDCKYLALPEFFKQAAQGQSQALELLFIPTEHVIIETEEWKKIKKHKDFFLSKKGIVPIIGFAIAQMHKAVVKGENLNKINHLIKMLDSSNLDKSAKIERYLTPWIDVNTKEITACGLFGIDVDYYVNDFGAKLIKIAGRDYDVGSSLKKLRESLEILEQKYGSRSRMAAESTYDYKSITHAFRLIGEAEEFIQTGKITFPRPDADFLLQVKNKEYYGDASEEIEKRLDNLKQNLLVKSTLQDTPNHKQINRLCQMILLDHIRDSLI